jgi:hypothetical protein
MYNLIERWNMNLRVFFAVFWVVFAPLLIVGAVVASAFYFEYYKCSVHSRGLDLRFTYGPVQGCMVQINDRQWVDIDRIRVTSDGDIIVGSDSE